MVQYGSVRQPRKTGLTSEALATSRENVRIRQIPAPPAVAPRVEPIEPSSRAVASPMAVDPTRPIETAVGVASGPTSSASAFDRLRNDITGREIPYLELVRRIVEPRGFQQRVVAAVEFGDPQRHPCEIDLR